MSELSYKELQEKGVFDVPYKAFQYMQEQQKVIDELTQALIKEQEEVLKYKPIYLNLIAENERLKMQMNYLHTWVGESKDQYCSQCGYK